MNAAILEHINITVTDPDGYAKTLCNMFGWHIRWAGPAQEKGYCYNNLRAKPYRRKGR